MIGKLLVLVSLCGWLPSVAFAQPAGAGLFKLTIDGPMGEARGPIYLFVEQSADGLKGIQLDTGATFEGNATAASMSFAFHVDTLGERLELHANFKGSLSERRLTGSVDTQMGAIPIVLVKISALWECGNHQNPKHIAESPREIKEHSTKNGCLLWHPLPLPPKN